VRKAAISRSMSIEAMEEVAQGRVWTGRQAKERGLVDHLGGLWKALEVAVSLLPPNEQQSFQQAYRVQKVMPPTTWFGLPSSLTPFGTTTTTASSASLNRIQPMAICSDEGFTSGLIGSSSVHSTQSELGKVILSLGISPQFVMSLELSGMFKKVESTLGKVLRQVVLGQKNSN